MYSYTAGILNQENNKSGLAWAGKVSEVGLHAGQDMEMEGMFNK